MKISPWLFVGCLALALCGPASVLSAEAPGTAGPACHERAPASAETLRVTTLILARDINAHLKTEEDVQRAIDWCRRHGLTKVYLETYRGNVWADRELITRARDAFREAGFEVSGCVTTTLLARNALRLENGALVPDQHLACYTYPGSQELLQEIFEFTAAIFDRIIIDDFFNTICVCEDCVAAKGDRSWSRFRADLLCDLSVHRILTPAKAVNPDCRITIKFPNFMDHWISSGYDLERQRSLFDAIYTGTETREPSGIDSNPQYAAYFLMQLLNAAGGPRNEGGWFDYIDATTATFLDQARQTVLGQARELMLFHFRVLYAHEEGVPKMAALHAELPELLQLANLVRGKTARGVVVAKPLDSSDLHLEESRIGADRYVFGFLGMLGIPLQPVVDGLPPAASLIGTRHLLYDEKLLAAFRQAAGSGVPSAITSNLAEALGGDPGQSRVLPFSNKAELMALPAGQIDALRNHLLAPLGVQLHCPVRVSLHLYDDDLAVLENFNDFPVEAVLSSTRGASATPILTIPRTAGATCRAETGGPGARISLPPRSLVVLRLE